MNLLKCSKGHYYDGDSYSQCPHCNQNPSKQKNSFSYTQPKQELSLVKKDEPKINITSVVERVVSWLFYSVFFSALPIGMYTFLNDLFEFGINNTDKYI